MRFFFLILIKVITFECLHIFHMACVGSCCPECSRKRASSPNEDQEKKKLKTEQPPPPPPVEEPEFHWESNGVHHDKKRNVRKYFRCSETNCNVKKKVLYNKNGTIQETKIEGTHLHPPPIMPKVDSQMLETAKEMLVQGVKPSQVHNHLLRTAKEGKLVPSSENLSKLKYLLKMKSLPTGTFILSSFVFFINILLFVLQEMLYKILLSSGGIDFSD